MYIGIISKRYAQALMDFAKERGEEAVAYSQLKKLMKNYSRVAGLRTTIENPMVGEADKLSLLRNATAGEATCSVLLRFFGLLLGNRREKVLPFIMPSFLHLYQEEQQIYRGRLITAVPVPQPTIDKMKASILRVHPGNKVEFETTVDPGIIGGCILEIEHVRIDASVASQLQSIKNQFIEKNRRIV